MDHQNRDGAAGKDVKTSSRLFGTIPGRWVEFTSYESGVINLSVVFGWHNGSIYIVMLRLRHCRQIVYHWATREAQTPMRLVLSLYQSQAKARRWHANIPCVCVYLRFPGGSAPCSENQLPCRRQVQSLGQEDPLQKEMKTHSSLITRKIPWTEKPGGLQSMGCKKVRHSVATEQYMRERDIYIYERYSISCNMSQNCHHLKVYK